MILKKNLQYLAETLDVGWSWVLEQCLHQSPHAFSDDGDTQRRSCACFADEHVHVQFAHK